MAGPVAGDCAPRAGIRELIFPRSIAVIGASPRRATAIQGAMRGGVPVWGVNPARTEVLGLRCHPSVADLPCQPELAFLLVGHDNVERAFHDAAAAGVRAFVLPGLGNEAGADGPKIAASIAAAAAEIDAAVLGPNCMGVVVPGHASSWIGTLPSELPPGRVSLVTQSGSIGEAFLALGGRVGFRSVISCGGEASRDAADLLAFLADDPGTHAIGLFLETVRRPEAFAAALERCAAAGKPVACLKVGRSRVAARAALAHTGALVGSSRTFSAVLRAFGVIEVQDFPDFVEVLEVLGRARRPGGARVGVISESGGEGALVADHAEAAGLALPSLPAETVAALCREFPNFVSPGNPLDAWAVDEADRVYPRSMELMAGSGAVDILVAQIDLSRFRGDSEKRWCEVILRALAEVAAHAGIFPAVTTVHGADPWPDIAAVARDADVPLLRGTGSAMRALSAVAHWKPRVPGGVPAAPTIDVSDLLSEPGPLSEFESAAVLERYGVPMARRRLAATPDEAVRAAVDLGFPVVVKVDGPAHKAAAGGVVLNLDRADAVRDAAERFGGRVLVAEQSASGPEVICGVVRDPDFGPVLAVGPGGRFAEALDMVATVLAPVDLERALELVDASPAVRALASPRARDAVARALVALGRLAADHASIEAAEVNPLLLSDDGAVAVDALVVVRQPERALSE